MLALRLADRLAKPLQDVRDLPALSRPVGSHSWNQATTRRRLVRLGVVAPGLEAVDDDELWEDLGHTRAIAESLAVPVTFETISEEKGDETKPTSPTHCL